MRFRLVLEQREEYPSEFEAIRSVAAKLGIGSAETLRKWVRRAEIDSGARPGATSAKHEQIKALKRENAELGRANEICGLRRFWRTSPTECSTKSPNRSSRSKWDGFRVAIVCDGDSVTVWSRQGNEP